MGGVGKACYLTLTLCAGAAYPTLRFDKSELTEVGFLVIYFWRSKQYLCFGKSSVYSRE